MDKHFPKSLLLTVVFAFFISGCAGSGNYGSLQRDRELEQMFLTYQVLPDYRYYTSGGYDKPNAILGVHKDYQLVSNYWQIIPDVDSAQVEKWIRTIDPRDRETGHNYFACYIIDPQGKRVGFWYSIQNYTVVKFLAEKKIEVYTPDLNQPGDEFGGNGRKKIIKPR
jgi:hypothetical protein